MIISKFGGKFETFLIKYKKICADRNYVPTSCSTAHKVRDFNISVLYLMTTSRLSAFFAFYFFVSEAGNLCRSLFCLNCNYERHLCGLLSDPFHEHGGSMNSLTFGLLMEGQITPVLNQASVPCLLFYHPWLDV